MPTVVRRIHLLAVPLLVASAGAQEPPGRQPTFALVLDAARAPLAGAEVTFAGWVPHVGAAGPHDVLVVAADERGRARAKLREDLCYLAWATTGDAEAGAVAPPLGYFAAGAMFELVCEPRPFVRHMAVEGFDAWAAHGPLRVFARTPLPGTERELPVRDGAIERPPWPSLQLEVRTADGQPLWSVSGAAATLSVPPPQRVRVRVLDADGAPVRDARLAQRVGQRRSWGGDGWQQVAEDLERDLGGVDDEGRAVVTICAERPLSADHERDTTLLFARAPGRPEVAGGRYHGAFYVDDRKVAQAPADEWPFRLPAPAPLAGYAGIVPPGTVAHLAATCKLFSTANSYYHDARAFAVEVGPGGRIEFAAVPTELHSCLLTLLPPSGDPTALPLLPARGGRELPFAPRDADLDAWRLPSCAMSLQVVDPLGGPARGAVVHVVPHVEGVLVRDAARQVPVRRDGSVRFDVVPGDWFVLVATDDGWAAGRYHCEEGAREERLAMQPLARLRVRLCGDDGAPVAGATVRTGRTTWTSSGDPMQGMLQNLWHTRRGVLQRLRTDADGGMMIPFVPVTGVVQRLRLEAGERRSPEFELTAVEDVLALRFE